MYFTVGGKPQYVAILKFCIETIRATCDENEAYDILVMCDENYKSNVSDIDNIDIMITPPNKDGVQASMRKVEIFSYDKIFNYDKVLYLDCDIVVKGSLSTLFDRIVDYTKLYVYKEFVIKVGMSGLYLWWNHPALLTAEIADEFTQSGIGFFNCGQFLFGVSQQMKQHFDNVLENIKNHTGSFFYEQSFMNEYFLLTKNTIQDPVIQDAIVLGQDAIGLGDAKNNVLIHHFLGAGTPDEIKLNKMKQAHNTNMIIKQATAKGTINVLDIQE